MNAALRAGIGVTFGVVAVRHDSALTVLILASALVALPRTRVLAIAAACGVALAVLHPEPASITTASRTARWNGTVVGDVVQHGDGTVFAFALASGTTVRASSRERVAPGERLRVLGRVAPLDEPRNPGEPSQRALGRDAGLAGALSIRRILARAPPDPHDARTWPARLRAAAAARLRRVIAEPEATVLCGALLGMRGELDAGLKDAFTATGTVHVLVTAGLHLGVFAGLILGLGRLVAVPRALAAGTAIAGALGYAWLTGAHLPSVRAAAMVTVACIAFGIGGRALGTGAIGVAAIVILIADPGSVESASFALSFSCVVAIAAFAEPIASALARWRLPGFLREPLALTVATQVGVWPLTAAVFATLAPFAIVANAIVVPAVALALPFGAAALLPGGAGDAAARIVAWPLAASVGTVRLVASLPFAHASMGAPPAWAIGAYDALALAAAFALRRKRMRLAAVALCAGAALVVVAALHHPPAALRITMLDVGQGDGIVVETRDGHVALIDSGGILERGESRDRLSPAERVGERVTLGFLRRAGIGHVDVLINTHPHGDHVGGCAPIVRALDVAMILDSSQPYEGHAFVDCVRAAAEHHVPVIRAQRGMVLNVGEATRLDVLAPFDPPARGHDRVNENSIVIRLRDPSTTALFTGDAGALTESRLLGAGDDLRADVLKVGHHGSAYASTTPFLTRVHPRFALISAGRNNHFGHPAGTTLARLQRAGAIVRRTDRCGATIVENGVVRTMLRPC